MGRHKAIRAGDMSLGRESPDWKLSDGVRAGTGADCWAAGAMVATPNGDKPIENIGGGEEVYGLTSDFTVERMRVQTVKRNGRAPTWKLSTASERSVAATADHLFLILRKIKPGQTLAWLALAEIKVGDLVVCVREDDDAHEVYFSRVTRVESGAAVETYALEVGGIQNVIVAGIASHHP